jgi:hypothetical protein
MDHNKNSDWGDSDHSDNDGESLPAVMIPHFLLHKQFLPLHIRVHGVQHQNVYNIPRKAASGSSG